MWYLLFLLTLGLASAAKSPANHAQNLVNKYPLIDTHIDLPLQTRVMYRKPMEAVKEIGEGESFPGHFDLARAKKGGLSGVFLTANAPCPESLGYPLDENFMGLNPGVEHALESMDIIYALAQRYPDRVTFATTASEIRKAHSEGKLAVLIGLEGAHTLQNSLSTLRMFVKLGVRYMTLTHFCHNAFASSAGFKATKDGEPTIEPVRKGNGLSDFGRELIPEMNRLGVLVDLSHTSDATASEAIDLSSAPIVWTHSGARSIYKHPRNIPDEILHKIGSGPGKNKGIVLSVLYPGYIDPEKPTISRVADHIEHVASVCGKAHVGLGSDFDGIPSTIVGMEDSSKWPNLIEEMINRGWTDEELEGLMGGNLLRVMDQVDSVKESLSHLHPSTAVYQHRKDLPAYDWGGPDYLYLSPKVKEIVTSQRYRDEL